VAGGAELGDRSGLGGGHLFQHYSQAACKTLSMLGCQTPMF
jgi:hypothetical protein